jgi:iron complex outermembrane receptor protein
MNTLYKHGLFLSSALAIAAAVPALASAQTAAPAAPQADQNATAIQEVVVTATRKEEKLQNVPISITAFSQAQLAQHNITNAEDLVNYTPSLSSVNFLGSTNTTFGLRGFQQDIGTQPAVGVYFADVVMPRGAANEMTIGDGAGPGAFFDLANLQVLNGPQGTLFGRNTTGGAILLVPQKPTHQFGGYVETEFGNHADERIQAVINLPLSDNLAVRLGVDHHQRDGYLTNTTSIGPHTFDDVNYTAFRGSVLWNVTPTIDNYTIFSYTRDQSNGTLLKLVGADPSAPFGAAAAAELAAHPGGYTVDSIFPGAADKETQWQVINTTTWRATDNLTIKNIASYAELKLDLGSSVFGTNLFANSIPLNPPVDFTDSNPLPGGHTGDQSTMTEELQAQGHAFDRKLDYTVGLYTEASLPLADVGSLSSNFLSCPGNGFTCASPLPSGAPGIGLGANTLTEAQTDFHNYGAYAEATYKFTDQWSLTGGFRYTWDREHVNGALKEYLYAQSAAPQPYLTYICTNPDATLPACGQSITTKAQAPTGRVSLQYKPTQDVMLYAKYSRGYRAGGVALQAPTGLQTFQPEHLNAYEVGAKTTWRNVIRGTFDVAAFYNDLSNQQVAINFSAKPGQPVPPETGIQNVGASRIYGVEIASSLKPTDSTRLDFGYTYLKTDLTKVAGVSVPATSPYIAIAAVQKGDPLTYSPQNKFTVTGTYNLPVPADLGDMSVAATYNYSDPQVTNYTERDGSGKLDGASLLKSRSLLDLNFDWRHINGSPVDLSAFATNVLGYHYWTLGLPEPTLGFEVAQIGAPRMFGVRLRYSFGR